MSVTTTLTALVPTAKKLPDAGVALELATAQLSLCAGIVKGKIATHWPASLFTAIFGGTFALRASVSKPVTLKVLVLLLPQASVATLVTVVMPTGKAKPEAMLELTGTFRS